MPHALTIGERSFDSPSLPLRTAHSTTAVENSTSISRALPYRVFRCCAIKKSIASEVENNDGYSERRIDLKRSADSESLVDSRRSRNQVPALLIQPHLLVIYSIIELSNRLANAHVPFLFKSD